MARDRSSRSRVLSFCAAVLLGAVCSCALTGPEPRLQILDAVETLSRAEFRFEPDVAFARDAAAVCLDLSCAEVLVRRNRRTIVIAPEAFDTPDRLRATLLEVWHRYREPRPQSVRDRAGAALRVLLDGPAVGVRDRYLLREAFRVYRMRFEELSPAERQGLRDPDTLVYP